MREFNPQYMISVKEYKAEGTSPRKQDFTKNDILELLIPIKKRKLYQTLLPEQNNDESLSEK